MKRILVVLLIVISSFMINNTFVLADTTAKVKDTNTCSSVFGSVDNKEDLAYYMQKVFNIMKFAGIILAIVMTIKDLIIAMSEQKNEMYAKLPGKTIKRIAYAIAIFLLPNIIEFLFTAIGLYGATCNIK